MKKLSLNSKIAISIGILIAGSVLILCLGLNRMALIADNLHVIVSDRVPKMMYANHMRQLLYLQLFNERSLILEESPEGMDNIIKIMEKRHAEMQDVLVQYGKIADDLGKENLSQFSEAYDSWWKFTQEIRKKALVNDDKAAFELSRQSSDFRKKAETVVTTMIERSDKRMENETADAKRIEDESKYMMSAVGIATILIGIAISFIVMLITSRTIKQVISALSSNAEQVTTAAHQIATSSEQLSEASTESASSLEETVRSEEHTSELQSH